MGKTRMLVRERAVTAYGPKTLKKHCTSAEVIEQINKGLPFSELEHLRHELEEPMESLAQHLSISRSTLQRRKSERRLSPQESDRVMRFWRILQHAAKVFGTIERARQWLKFPQFGLDGAVPLEFAKTEIGAREVDNLLGRPLEVEVRDSLEKAMKILKQKMSKEGILQEVKRRRFYEKPSVKRKRNMREARKRRRREAKRRGSK